MSSNENKPWNDARITAYVLDELSPDERTAFEKEMAADDALAQAVTGASQVTGQLSSLFKSESTPPLSDQRRDAIINEPVVVRPEDEKSSRTAIIAFLAMAACTLLVFGLSPLMQKGSVATLSKVTETDPSPSATMAVGEVSSKADQTSDEDAAELFGSDAEEWSEMLAKENAYRESRKYEPLAWNAKGVPTPGPVPEAGPAAPTVLRSTLERNRNRLEKSVSLEFQSQVVGPPDIKVVPSEPASGIASARAKESGVWAAKIDRESIAATPKPSPGMQDKSSGNSYQRQTKVQVESRGRVYGLSIAREPTEGFRNDRNERLAELQQGDFMLADIALDKELVPLIIERDKYAAEFGVEHPTVRNLDAQLSTMKSDLRILGRRQSERVMNLEGRTHDRPRGPGTTGDRFDPIIENDFIRTADHPLSTFSVDVDTASYSKVRDFLMRANRMPLPDAVRIEEMINYFDYADAPPADDAEHPFAASVNLTECPWNDGHRLARIAIRGKTMKPKDRPACNLVFLLDTSGSMNATNKLPLVVEGMKMLTGQLKKNDKVAIVVYAGSAGLVLDSTPAKKKKKIRRALENLSAGGSTNGGRGIELAYQTAREHFIEGGVNRVILCTDGDFNVGTTGTDSLVRMVEKEAKDDVYLTVLGFGMGNHNDAMLEQISGRGNGNYAFIDNQREAHKVLVKQTAGTLVTIAKDVKLQVKFSPAKVGAYRLIGYENRILAKEDFNDDKKDAGEIGAGHSVTALYELVPPELADKLFKPAVDESKYAAKDKEIQPTPAPSKDDAKKDSGSKETLTVRVRYKQPDSDTSTRVDFPATDDGQSFDDSSIDTRFTAAVAGFGMLLRGSQHSGDWEFADALEVAQSAIGDDESELRSEFVKLVEKAKQLRGE